MANQHRLDNWSTEDNNPVGDARSLRYMLGINSADNRASPVAGNNISYVSSMFPFDGGLNTTTTAVTTTTTGRRWWNQPILNEVIDGGINTTTTTATITTGRRWWNQPILNEVVDVDPTSFLEDDDPISYNNSSHYNFPTRPHDFISFLSYEEHPWMNFIRRRNDLSSASTSRVTGEAGGSSSPSRSSGHNDNNNNLDFSDTFLAPTIVPWRPGSSVPPPPPPSSPSLSDYLINPHPPQSEQYMQTDSTLASSENPARPGSNNGIFISTSEIRAERDRLMDEIQSTLQHLRNGGSIRSEDVMILDFLVTLNPLIDSEDWSNQIMTALEGHIGRVERGLTEEEILRCIHEETYQFNPNETSTQNQTCTICQEDFVDGERIGRLECIHVYHLHCIKQWLELRNACPICKKTALEIIEDEDEN